MIVRGKNPDVPSPRRGDTFTGDVWAGQIPLILAGRGLIRAFGEKPQPLRAGETVWVPPSECHRYGAAPTSFMTHTATSLGVTQWANEVSEVDHTSAASE